MAPYRETAQCLHLKRERMSEYLMKWKKWIALALSAVMAVSMLTACGGGGGVTSTLSASRLLEDAGSDAVIVRENKLSTAVQLRPRMLLRLGLPARQAGSWPKIWDGRSQTSWVS